MALIRWEPTRELGTVQDEMNRMFSTFFDSATGSGNPGQTSRWTPPMDLVETERAFVLQMDLPGLAQEDVTIEFDAGVLSIGGERKLHHEGHSGYRRCERGFGPFRRTVALPRGVDGDAITATFERGVLEVVIPKPEQPAPHRVQISVGNGGPAVETADTSSADTSSASADQRESVNA